MQIINVNEALQVAQVAQQTADGKVSKAGDTMTGNLRFANNWSGDMFESANRLFYFRTNPQSNTLEIVVGDKAGTPLAISLNVQEDGKVNIDRVGIYSATFSNKALARTDVRVIPYHGGELVNTSVRTNTGAGAATSFIIMQRK